MTDFNFFKPTEEDINEAQNGGALKFKKDENVGFLIEDVNEKVDEGGDSVLVVGCQVLTGDNEGKKFSHWIRNNKTSKGIWINMLKAFFDDETIMSGTLTPASLISRKMESKCVINTSKGKEYANFYKFKEFGVAPDIGGQTPEVKESDIPF